MPYKIEVLNYVDVTDAAVSQIGAANTVINEGGRLSAYNTDSYAAMAYLDMYDNRKPLYIIGNGGYAKAVKWASNSFNVNQITRDNWDELFDIKDSIVYNCTPVDITDWIDKSNDFINCLVTTQTGIDLATLQASKQFELYTGLEFPL
jgi:shikimate 5-dehydrogenase